MPKFFLKSCVVILLLLVTGISWADTVDLYVNSTDGLGAWDVTGSSPYLDAQDQPTNYIGDNDRNNNSGVFGFDDSADLGTITGVDLYIYADATNAADFTPIINATDTSIDPPTSYGWVSGDISGIVGTWAAINSATMYLDRPNTTNQADCDAAYIKVTYTPSTGRRNMFISWLVGSAEASTAKGVVFAGSGFKKYQAQSDSFLLLETEDALLLETGDKLILE